MTCLAKLPFLAKCILVRWRTARWLFGDILDQRTFAQVGFDHMVFSWITFSSKTLFSTEPSGYRWSRTTPIPFVMRRLPLSLPVRDVVRQKSDCKTSLNCSKALWQTGLKINFDLFSTRHPMVYGDHVQLLWARFNNSLLLGTTPIFVHHVELIENQSEIIEKKCFF